MTLLIWKLIACCVLLFFGIGVAFILLKAVIIILSPFVIVFTVSLGIVTYPITLLARLLGYRCPSVFGLLIEYHRRREANSYSRVEAERRAKNQRNNYQYQYRQQEEPAKEPPRQKEVDPWELLGVPRGAPRAEIMSAFRRKMQDNHPDKVANLDPELQKFATVRTILIKKACDDILQSRA